MIHGRIIALVHLPNEVGEWELGAQIETHNGPALGYLAAPENGAAGPIRFEPLPDELASRVAPVPGLVDPPAAGPVPPRAPALPPESDPDNPRGLARATQQGVVPRR